MIDTQIIINNEYVQIGLILIIVLLSYIIGRLLHERKIKKMVVERTSKHANDIGEPSSIVNSPSLNANAKPEVPTPPSPPLPTPIRTPHLQVVELRETDLVTQEKISIVIRDDALMMNDNIKDLMINEQIDKMISLTVFINAIILILCFLI